MSELSQALNILVKTGHSVITYNSATEYGHTLKQVFTLYTSAPL